ncbi:MAG: asparagine synthase (glutamine-hydrolyzing) [Clostridia bacterium]|nr:asparagine synthase (glutamine-hydrolyzing) [Clostridia bacterium]
MCSICGIADFNNSSNINVELINKMGMTMKHRGPDFSDTFSDGKVAFQHNRLSVMDPQNGHQPMTAEFDGKKYTIVYNGEIYNTKDLKTELMTYGVKFLTNCDTEAVLYSYIIFGDKCAEKLNGIFAFAVYDHSMNRLFLARDRFGVKPFFYGYIDNSFVFASEIKAILAHPEFDAKIDETGLWQLLFLSPVTINGSGVFKDIFELKPAQCGYFDKDGLKLKTYWELKAQEFRGNSKTASEHTKCLLEDAVKQQIIADVPLCTFLSGGLDSSVITAIASKAYKERGEILPTYSFEYEDNKKNFKQSLFQPQGDDEFAVFLAEWLGTKHTVLTAPTLSVAQNLIPAAVYRDIPGQADIDSSLLYFCGEVKNKHTVALSGECADEIFGGYPWFYRKEMLDKDFFPWIHKPMARIELFDDNIVKAKMGYEYISEVYKKTVSDVPMLDTDTEDMKTARIATILSVKYFMTSLLERKDRMSMAHGLEVRVPFSDYRILEYVYNVPWSIKFENRTEKALLRNAMKDYLPDKILYRKKSPYPKTHNPKYEEYVTDMLNKRLKSGIIGEMLNIKTFNEMMSSDYVTWFGQLMSKPQLIAWLVQFDYWFEIYNVKII